MLTFYLWNVPGISLLIPAKSGVLYATQTGGHHCLQQSVEAILLPLINHFEHINQEELLSRHFVSKWGGWCGEDEGIDAPTADDVDEVLRATPYTAWLQVDRTRLQHSHEAWVYVKPIALHRTETIDWSDFDFASGIVTWPNSD